jgi:transketolase
MISDQDIKLSIERCKKYRRKILDISQKVTALHMGGSFSSLEMVDYIYNFHIPLKKKNENDNIFIMSKGHSCMTQYVILENRGILKKKDLENYCKSNGILGCHPDYGNPGIEASTGSLGHGLALAVGICHANKIDNNSSKTFVILSDGELQEGSTWEALMMAANLNLNNLICFLDHNGSQSYGVTKEVHPKFYPIEEKIRSFNWETRVANGHDTKDIDQKFRSRSSDKPFFIIGNTVKGKGVSYMENKPIWHYRSPTPEEYLIGIKEIDEGFK